MKFFLALIASLIFATSSIAATTTQTHCNLAQQSVSNAFKYQNLRELTNRNDHPTIDSMHKYVGLDNKARFKAKGEGYAWCAAFVLWNYKEAAEFCGVPQPLPKTAGVANLWQKTRENPIRYTTFTVDQVRLGLIKLQPGDLIIWKNGNVKDSFITGHTGLSIVQTSNVSLKTIEGNTLPESAGQGGNQREGGGVYVRNRYLSPGKFYILGFVRTK